MSLADELRSAGIELIPGDVHNREQARRATGRTLKHPHKCRGCGRWIERADLDEHEPRCERPEVVRRYRERKREMGRRSAHRRFHVARGRFDPGCRLCWRDRGGRASQGHEPSRS